MSYITLDSNTVALHCNNFLLHVELYEQGKRIDFINNLAKTSSNWFSKKPIGVDKAWELVKKSSIWDYMEFRAIPWKYAEQKEIANKLLLLCKHSDQINICNTHAFIFNF